MKSGFLQIHDRPIVVYRAYVRLTGSSSAGMFLSQILYWCAAVNGRPFYKVDAEIEEETGLTPKEIRNAKSLLKRFSFIEIKAKGVPPKTWYTVDVTALQAELDKLGGYVQNDQINLAERAKLKAPKGPNRISPKGENFTEMTTEKTANSVKDNAPTLAETNEQEAFNASEAIAAKMLASERYKTEAFAKLHPELHRPATEDLPKFGAWWLSKNAATYSDAELRDYVKRLNPANLWARWGAAWAPNLKPAGQSRFKQPEPPRPARPVFI